MTFDPYRYWISADDMLRVNFELILDAHDHLVKYSIERINDPAREFEVLKGYFGHKEIEVSHVYADGYKIDAKFALIDLGAAPSCNVWSDFFFGDNLFGHFEGVMVSYQHTGPIPPHPPHPPHPPRPPEPPAFDVVDDVVDVALSDLREFDLFPYVQMQFWPDLTPKEHDWNFINYTYADENNLFKALMEIRQSSDANARELMLDTTLDFINNDTFYHEWSQVPFPFCAYPEIYDHLIAHEFHHEEIVEYCCNCLDISEEDIWWLDSTPNYEEILDNLWQNFFALAIVNGYSESILTLLSKTLLINHLFDVAFEPTSPPKHFTSIELHHLLRATIILSAEVFPLPPFSISSPPITTKTNGWLKPFAIGFLQMVKQRLHRYELGEVSRIVNVGKGERKEIVHRNLNKEITSSYQSKQSDSDLVNGTDESSTNLNSEARKTVADITYTANYTDLDISYGPMIVNGSSCFEVKPNPGQPEINTFTEFAKRVLSRTVNRIQESVTKARTSTHLSEEEETVSSVLDNTKADWASRAIYRWINKIYQARVVNYGHRLIIEFIIRNPASFYKKDEAQLFDGKHSVKYIL